MTTNRSDSLNAFTPKTVEKLQLAFADARDDMEIGVVILTGQGRKAFCSGGDVGVHSSNLGHVESGKKDTEVQSSNVGHVEKEKKVPRLNVFDLQNQIRRMPKPKKARLYNAQEALIMGLVNTVVPLEQLEQETVKWCREIISNSPTTLRVLKAAINATEGKSDQQALAGNVTMIMYASEEAEEGRRA